MLYKINKQGVVSHWLPDETRPEGYYVVRAANEVEAMAKVPVNFFAPGKDVAEAQRSANAQDWESVSFAAAKEEYGPLAKSANRIAEIIQLAMDLSDTKGKV